MLLPWPSGCRIRIAAAILALLALSSAHAEQYRPTINPSRPFDFTYLAASGGLEQRNILDIDFEPDGAVWLAGSDGAYRYDGYRWQRFTEQDGLPSDFVRAVLVASDGRVWVGTERGAAVRVGERFEAVPADRLAGQSVRRIVEDPDGSLWFCSDRWPDPAYRGGLTRLQDGDWTTYRAPGDLPNDYVVNYFRDSQGRRYLITLSGPSVWEGDRWRQLPGLANAEEYEWQSAEMVEGPGGRVWLSTGDILLAIRDGRLEKRYLPSVQLRYGLANTRDGEVFAFGSASEGGHAIYRWDGQDFEQHSGPIEGPRTLFVERLREAPDGALWVIGFGYVLRWSRLASEWVEYVGLPPPVAVDERDRVWFANNGRAVRLDGERWDQFDFPYQFGKATLDGGVAVASSSRVAYWDDFEESSFGEAETGIRRIQGLNLDAEGTWWIHGVDAEGSFALSFYDGERWGRAALPSLPETSVVRLSVDPKQGIWYLCRRGRSSENRLGHAQKSGQAQWHSIEAIDKDFAPPLMYADRRGRVWIYGLGGLRYWDGASGSLIPEELPGQPRAIDAMADVDGKLWVAVSGHLGGGGSLLRLDSGGWTVVEANFAGSVIFAPRGQNFLAGRQLLHRLTPGEEGPVEIPVPIPRHAAVRRALIDHSGRLWVVAGSVVLKRQSGRSLPETSLESDSEIVRIGEEATVRLRGLERFDPEGEFSSFQFAWRLDGGPWSEYEHRTSLLVPTDDLAVGAHRLEVRARDQDLEVDPSPAALDFTVAAVPLQERLWFLPLLVAVAILFAGLAGVALASRRSLAQANLALQQANRELDASRSEQIADERRRADAAVERERNLLRAVIDELPDYVFVKDGKGRFLAANEALARDLGLNGPDEVLGKTDFDLYPAELAEQFRADDQMVMSRGEALLNREETIAVRGGVSKWSLTTKVPFYGEEGRMLGIVAVSRDISQLKQAERDRELLRLELQQSKKLEALGVLAGGIAHDFNNILTVIQGNIELVRMNFEETADDAARLDAAQKAADRARDLVRAILTFGRRGDGARMRVFEAEPVVREVLELLRPTLPSSIELRATLAAPGVLVRGNESEMHQLVVNLVTNAFQAIGNPSGLIEVTLEPAGEGDRKALRLRVADSGGGVDPAIEDRIFDPFFSTKGPGEGTGLGLAVVHGIVKAFQGTIELRNHPGEGAEFEVLLPLSAGIDAVESDAAPVSAGQTPSEAGEILFVDDEQSIRSLGEVYLARLSCESCVCADAAQALGLIEQAPHRFRVLVTDLTMPGMDGLELSRKAHVAAPQLPIVLMTGYGHKMTELEQEAAGIVLLLQKPFRLNQLASAIRQATKPG